MALGVLASLAAMGGQTMLQEYLRGRGKKAQGRTMDRKQAMANLQGQLSGKMQEAGTQMGGADTTNALADIVGSPEALEALEELLERGLGGRGAGGGGGDGASAIVAKRPSLKGARDGAA